MIELGERVDQAHHAGRDQVVQLDVLWKPLVDPPRQVAHRGKVFQQNLVALRHRPTLQPACELRSSRGEKQAIPYLRQLRKPRPCLVQSFLHQ